MAPMSLRGEPLEAEVSIPDGRTVKIRIGVADDSYIGTRELDTVTVELSANGDDANAVVQLGDGGFEWRRDHAPMLSEGYRRAQCRFALYPRG